MKSDLIETYLLKLLSTYGYSVFRGRVLHSSEYPNDLISYVNYSDNLYLTVSSFDTQQRRTRKSMLFSLSDPDCSERIVQFVSGCIFYRVI